MTDRHTTGSDCRPTSRSLGASDQPERPRRKSSLWFVISLLAVHTALLAYGAWMHSPSVDEMGHLPSGVAHWKFGEFAPYRVNPPLVRMVAALPVVPFTSEKMSWAVACPSSHYRSEWGLATQFCHFHRSNLRSLFFLARCACIPFSIVGGVVCFLWSRDLFGPAAARLSLILWCFSPVVLANAQMITPDTGATSLGLTACYVFWKWLKKPTPSLLLLAGVALGAAELTKTTWIVLYAIFPVAWFFWRVLSPSWPSWKTWLGESIGMSTMLVCSLFVLNAGYGFSGVLKPLGEFQFSSSTLSGERVHDVDFARRLSGNRFAGTWFGRIPSPFPEDYLYGIDRQKMDLELRRTSYLRGQWQDGGWWYYYLYGIVIKEPLGVLFLAAIAILFAVNNLRRRDLGSEAWLLAPGLAILIFVSSQTGFNRHLRYVLPAAPFLYVWISSVAQSLEHRRQWIRVSVVCFTSFAVGSSMYAYPHSLSYFNELVGGPRNGPLHLLNSNIDWGQDLPYLRQWMAAHPEARPLGLEFPYANSLIEPETYGVAHRPIPRMAAPEAVSEPRGPHPGWWAISVNILYDEQEDYAYLRDRFHPESTAGYSIYIFHLTPADVDRVRRQMGLPELEEEL